MSERKLRKIRCPFCGYGWITRSTMRFVSCPSCLKKVEIEPNIIKEQEAMMEHFNLDAHGVKVLDHSLISSNNPRGRIVDVHFTPTKVWCEYDQSENCRHVQFALLLPMVQKILEKKGWKIKG